MKVLAGIGIFVFVLFAVPRAYHFELASAGSPPVRKQVSSADVVDGHDVHWWARHSRYNGRLFRQADKDRDARGRTIRHLQSALTVRPRDHALRAIAFASTAYGVSYSTLRRKAYCETGGTFDPYAKNPRSTASGLFQFLTGTWSSTPYARYSIWDPYANALAAAWMHSKAVGRGGEWACK